MVETSAIIATHLMEIIKNNAAHIVSRQDVKQLLDNIKAENPAVVEEVIPQISIGTVQKVLQNLLKERIPIRDMITILETLADFIPVTREANTRTEYVRQSLSTIITQIFKSADGKIHAMTLDPRNEQMINELIKQAAQSGTAAILPPDVIQKLTKVAAEMVEQMISKGHTPILLTSPGIRMHFHAMIEPIIPGLIVLSYSELTPTVPVESEGGISSYED